MAYILINGTLYHHGIKGQKWGIRNYQNDDGSLTPEGKIRYGYDGKLKPKRRKEERNERIKRINKEAESVKNSKVSDREKAKVLSKMGKHSDSADYYRKDLVNTRNLAIALPIVYKIGTKAASKYMAKSVIDGKMSFDSGVNVASAVNIGYRIAQGYLTYRFYDDAKKHSKEYWRLD